MSTLLTLMLRDEIDPGSCFILPDSLCCLQPGRLKNSRGVYKPPASPFQDAGCAYLA